VSAPVADDRALELPEQLAWLALSWGAELGPAGFARVVRAYGSAQAALEAQPDHLVHGEARLKPEQAAAFPHLRQRAESFQEELGDLARQGIRVHFSPDPAYPRLLRELPHPPPVVCVAGEVMPIDDLAVALVGTRSPTLEGVDMAGNLARVLAGEDFTVVSGLARGVDTAAHLGALEGDGRTIAVLGSGILNIHPQENLPLSVRLQRQGALLSELPPRAQPTVPNLMARNRLISILARAVVVVECRATGGSLATAEAALHQGRELYAVDWARVHDGGVGSRAHEEHAGNRELLHAGARPLAGPGEVHEVCHHLRGFRRSIPPPPREQAAGQMSLFG
jgi:DNA processing protein